jgi:GTP cyclohydrolase IA
MFGRRLQIQEQLTQQIGECVQGVTLARGVAVVTEAKHRCVIMRGVEKQHSQMITLMMLGAFRKDRCTRAEFLGLIRN